MTTGPSPQRPSELSQRHDPAELFGHFALSRSLPLQPVGWPRRSLDSWTLVHEPRREETALRDAIQRLALAHRFYGYRRIGELLRREGWAVNRKRVLRLMREDNLLCLRRAAFRPPTTDARHGWPIWPNLARRLVGQRPTSYGWPTSPMCVWMGLSSIWRW